MVEAVALPGAAVEAYDRAGNLSNYDETFFISVPSFFLIFLLSLFFFCLLPLLPSTSGLLVFLWGRRGGRPGI